MKSYLHPPLPQLKEADQSLLQPVSNDSNFLRQEECRKTGNWHPLFCIPLDFGKCFKPRQAAVMMDPSPFQQLSYLVVLCVLFTDLCCNPSTASEQEFPVIKTSFFCSLLAEGDWLCFCPFFSFLQEASSGWACWVPITALLSAQASCSTLIMSLLLF